MKSIDWTRAQGALVACAVLCLATATAARGTEEPRALSASQAGYIGSAECAGCHTQTYQSWWATRHAYSVQTADQARLAGYPLPSDGGRPIDIKGWPDVSYVIGGRQRIAYANMAGQVLDAAYHNRIGKWSIYTKLDNW